MAATEAGGKNLMVHRDRLRDVAAGFGHLADELETALASCASANVPAEAVGSWPEAQQLAGAVGRTYTGISQFVDGLRQAYGWVQARLEQTAGIYDANEQALAAQSQAIHPATQAQPLAASGSQT